MTGLIGAPDPAVTGVARPAVIGADGRGPGLAGTDLVTLGESMALLCAPRLGPLRHASSLDLSCAGAEMNLAIGLSRLGHRASWIGRVGNDEFGVMIRRALAAEGVDGRLVVDPDAPTGLMVKARRTEAVTQVVYYRTGSAGSRLCPADLDATLIAGARVLHLTGITPALSGPARDAVRYAIEVARGAGVTISLDFNYRSALWSATAAGAELTELVGLADVVFAGEAEARLVVDAPDAPGIGRALAALGPSQVLVKRGPLGAAAIIEDTLLELPAYPVTSVDPIGAGDAFAAGYLSGLLDGLAPAARLDRAARAGAFAVTVPGDWEGLPSRAELDLLHLPDAVLR